VLHFPPPISFYSCQNALRLWADCASPNLPLCYARVPEWRLLSGAPRESCKAVVLRRLSLNLTNFPEEWQHSVVIGEKLLASPPLLGAADKCWKQSVFLYAVSFSSSSSAGLSTLHAGRTGNIPTSRTIFPLLFSWFPIPVAKTSWNALTLNMTFRNVGKSFDTAVYPRRLKHSSKAPWRYWLKLVSACHSCLYWCKVFHIIS